MEVVNNLHIGLKKVSEKKSDSPNDLINLVKNTYNAEKMIAKKLLAILGKKQIKKIKKKLSLFFKNT